MGTTILRALLFTAVLAPPGVAKATSAVRLDDRSLALLSDAILVGTVRSVAAIETTSALRTEIMLQVEETWKGALEAGDKVRFTTLGGAVGGRSMYVDGAPIFLLGERVLVHLERKARSGEWRVLGWEQGKFSVRDVAGVPHAVKQSLPPQMSGKLLSDPEVKRRFAVPTSHTEPLADRHAQLKRILADDARNNGGTPPRERAEFRGIGR